MQYENVLSLVRSGHLSKLTNLWRKLHKEEFIADFQRRQNAPSFGVQNLRRREVLSGIGTSIFLLGTNIERSSAEKIETDVQVTVDNLDSRAWKIIATNGGAIAPVGSENPQLNLRIGNRYTFINEGWDTHPLSFRGSNANPLLSQSEEGAFEDDTNVDWNDSGADLSFTLTEELATEITTYHCTVHSPMQGTVKILGPDAPPAEIIVPDQESPGSTVIIDFVRVDDGGFVTIHDSRLKEGVVFGSIRGVSQYLKPGIYEQLVVELDEPFIQSGETKIIGRAYRDTNETEEFEFIGTSGEEDRPYLDRDDEPISDSGEAVIVGVGSIFTVETIEPADITAKVGNLVSVSAEIMNTGDSAGSGEIEFIIDGDLRAEKTIDLDIDESKTVSFDINTERLEPGEYSYSVETGDENRTGILTLENENPNDIDDSDGSTDDENVDNTATDADGEGIGFGIPSGLIGIGGAIGYALYQLKQRMNPLMSVNNNDNDRS